VELAARQLLRAIRGQRSQVAFARRLGYRGNPLTDWERGARFPTGEETLRAAAKAGIDVAAAFARFVPQLPLTKERGRFALSRWLDALRGTASVNEIAARAGHSRYTVSRWLRGLAKPRLPDLLVLIDAITDRAPHWVAALVPIDQVPALSARFSVAEAARRAAFELPWTEAVLRLLEVRAVCDAEDVEDRMAGALRIDRAEIEQCLQALLQSGAIARVEGRYVVRSISVDTQGGAGALHRIKQHWCRVAGERLATPAADELFAYNVVSVSRADLVVIRERLRGVFREIRTIVAASSPEEVAAVMNLHLLAFDPEA
jgi:transcriptional regulator with XRE-family HTH domain